MFRALADRPEFPNRLFWVGFRDEQPSAEVKKACSTPARTCTGSRATIPTPSCLQLASRLGCFPPGFFAKPFSHLMECFGSLAGFRLPGQDQDLDWAARARGWIEKAIETFEAMPAAVAAGAPAPAPAAPPPRPPRARRLGLRLPRPLPPPSNRSWGARCTAAAPPAAPAPAAAAPARAEGDVVGAGLGGDDGGGLRQDHRPAPALDAGEIPELAELLAWAYVRSAQLLIGRAKGGPEDQRAKLLQEAEQQALQAEEVQPGVGAPDLARIAA